MGNADNSKKKSLEMDAENADSDDESMSEDEIVDAINKLKQQLIRKKEDREKMKKLSCGNGPSTKNVQQENVSSKQGGKLDRNQNKPSVQPAGKTTEEDALGETPRQKKGPSQAEKTSEPLQRTEKASAKRKDVVTGKSSMNGSPKVSLPAKNKVASLKEKVANHTTNGMTEKIGIDKGTPITVDSAKDSQSNSTSDILEAYRRTSSNAVTVAAPKPRARPLFQSRMTSSNIRKINLKEESDDEVTIIEEIPFTPGKQLESPIPAKKKSVHVMASSSVKKGAIVLSNRINVAVQSDSMPSKNDSQTTRLETKTAEKSQTAGKNEDTKESSASRSNHLGKSRRDKFKKKKPRSKARHEADVEQNAETVDESRGQFTAEEAPLTEQGTGQIGQQNQAEQGTQDEELNSVQKKNRREKEMQSEQLLDNDTCLSLSSEDKYTEKPLPTPTAERRAIKKPTSQDDAKKMSSPKPKVVHDTGKNEIISAGSKKMVRNSERKESQHGKKLHAEHRSSSKSKIKLDDERDQSIDSEINAENIVIDCNDAKADDIEEIIMNRSSHDSKDSKVAEKNDTKSLPIDKQQKKTVNDIGENQQEDIQSPIKGKDGKGKDDTKKKKKKSTAVNENGMKSQRVDDQSKEESNETEAKGEKYIQSPIRLKHDNKKRMKNSKALLENDTKSQSLALKNLKNVHGIEGRRLEDSQSSMRGKDYENNAKDSSEGNKESQSPDNNQQKNVNVIEEEKQKEFSSPVRAGKNKHGAKDIEVVEENNTKSQVSDRNLKKNVDERAAKDQEENEEAVCPSPVQGKDVKRKSAAINEMTAQQSEGSEDESSNLIPEDLEIEAKGQTDSEKTVQSTHKKKRVRVEKRTNNSRASAKKALSLIKNEISTLLSDDSEADTLKLIPEETGSNVLKGSLNGTTQSRSRRRKTQIEEKKKNPQVPTKEGASRTTVKSEIAADPSEDNEAESLNPIPDMEIETEGQKSSVEEATASQKRRTRNDEKSKSGKVPAKKDTSRKKKDVKVESENSENSVKGTSSKRSRSVSPKKSPERKRAKLVPNMRFSRTKSKAKTRGVKKEIGRSKDNVDACLLRFRSIEALKRKIEAGTEYRKIARIDTPSSPNSKSADAHAKLRVLVKQPSRKNYKFVCPEAGCGKRFRTRKNQLAHKRAHGPKRYKCDECKVGYAYRDALVNHMLAHEGVKQYECDQCGQQMTTRSMLKGHLRSHFGIRPHKCKICGLAFSWRTVLNIHMRVHTKEKPYECQQCGKRFAHAPSLKAHSFIHSGVKEFACQECGASYSRKASLQIHLNIHAGVKPFACDKCDCAFVHKSYLIRHAKKHEEQVVYTCKMCKRVFKKRHFYLKHKEREH